VAIGLGSNLGDRLGMLRAALSEIASFARVEAVSSVWATEPRDVLRQPPFLNAALLLLPPPHLSPAELLRLCLDVEARLGRVREAPRGPRSIDIDLLLWGDLRVEEGGVVVPHPRLASRRFVLAPLAEIAPHMRHPGLDRSIASLLASCPDDGAVERLGPLRGPR
jgi:2-amino-4-hydroxy-6-hydroxymethyldihydropteridine diphosphokinase